MSDVKPVAWQRLDFVGTYDDGLFPCGEGDFVAYDDALATVTALQAENKLLREALNIEATTGIGPFDTVEELIASLDDDANKIKALQAEIEALRQKAGTGRAIIIDLLDQIESLQSYELTRDLEGYKAQAIWDSAIENAKRYAAIAKEKQP